jgi:hypothetical protein
MYLSRTPLILSRDFLLEVIISIMRTLKILAVTALLLPLGVQAQEATTTGATVSYSSSTEFSCPDNSYLGGKRCYCNSGYKISGSTCVKDAPAPVAQNEIYDDIFVAASFNTDLACTQLGFTSAENIDMCQKFKSNPSTQWKRIPRPSVSAPMITNPWAQAGQQTLTAEATAPSLPAIETTPPPPPPPPAPTTTPEIVKTPEAPVSETKPEPVPEPKPKEEPPVQTQETPKPEAAKSVDTQSSDPLVSAHSQLAGALAAGDLVAMSSILASLEPKPEPPSVAPMPQQEASTPEPEPEKPTGFFKKIIGWFLSMF